MNELMLDRGGVAMRRVLEGLYGIDGNRLYGNGFNGLADDTTTQLIYELMQLGVTTEEIYSIFDRSSSIDEFTQNLINFKNITEESAEPLTTLLKGLSEYKTIAEQIDEINKAHESGEGVSFSMISGLIEKYPELLAYINDEDKLIEKLGEIRKKEEQNQRDLFKNYILTDPDMFKNSIFFDEFAGGTGASNLAQLMDFYAGIQGGDTLIAQVDAWVDGIVDVMLGGSEEIEQATQTLADRVKEVNELWGYVGDLDATSSDYTTESAIAARDALIAKFPALKDYTSDMVAFIQEAKRLVRESSEEVQSEAEALGFVVDIKAKMSSYYRGAKNKDIFDDFEDNSF